MRHLIHFLFLVLVVNASYSQGNSSNTELTEKEISYNEIIELNSNSLLVRLKSKQNTIDALTKAGKEEKANKIAKKQHTLNSNIIKAFREEFNFCKVHFFYSNYTDEVASNNLRNVIFLNDQLLPDASIIVTDSVYYTAEVSLIQQDTTKYFEGYRIEHTENGAVKVPVYSGGTNMSFQALRIMNSKFQQLSKPFPYFERTINSIPIVKKKMPLVVKQMQKKLNKHLRKAVQHYAKIHAEKRNERDD